MKNITNKNRKKNNHYLYALKIHQVQKLVTFGSAFQRFEEFTTERLTTTHLQA